MKYLFQSFVIQMFLLYSFHCLTEDEKKHILDTHNYYRRLVAQGKVSGQPRASNMLEMTWNDESAAIAQKNAEICVFDHTPRNVRLYGKHKLVGENIAMFSFYNLTSAIEAWFSEHDYYTFRSTWCSGVCGHYTQLVWADSNELGCGAAYCEGRDNGKSYGTILFCNYGPGGNYMETQPYKSGRGCTKCPKNTKCTKCICASI